MTSRGDTRSFAQTHRHLARGGRYFPRWFSKTPFWKRLPAAHRAVLRELFDRLVHADTEHRESGIHVRSGEWLTSYGAIAADSGATYKQARTAIEKACKAGVIQTQQVHYTTATGTRHLLRIMWLDFDAYEWPDEVGEPRNGRSDVPPDAEGQDDPRATGPERAGRTQQTNTLRHATCVQPNEGEGQDPGQDSGQDSRHHSGHGTGQHSGQQKEPSGITLVKNPQQQGTHSASSVGPAAASDGVDGEENQDVREALRQIGVTEPVLSELARQPGLHAPMIQRRWHSLRERGKGVGVLINELRAAAEQAEAVSKSARPRDPAELRLTKLTSEERRKIEEAELSKMAPGSLHAYHRLAPERRELRVRELILAHLRANPPTEPASGAQPPDT